MSRQLTALGGDIFAGLFTVGVQAAGFKILGHLEHGAYGVATAKKNFPGLDVRIGPHAWRPEEFTGRVDLMYTNPPCAAWSNMRKGSKHNWDQQTERLSCVTDLTQAGMIIRPKAWVWESVVGAWTNGREFVLERAREWNLRGYDVTILLQDNQYLGTPQARQRMLFIAHKHPLVWPPFTKPVTVAQVLKKVPKRHPPGTPEAKELSPLHAELWKRSANMKGRMREAFDQLTRQERAALPGGTPLNVFRRLMPDQPAPVMLEANKRLHPTEPRMLTWNEWLALCGLPYTFKTACASFVDATLELSRAVMPPVGEWIARAVEQGLLEAHIRKPGACRLVDMRKPDAIVEELLWRNPERDHAPITWNPPPPTPKAERAARSPRVTNGVTRPTGSGARIRDLLELGHDTEEILSTIHAEFPGSKATASDISWNRRKLRQLKGEL
jgi:site-specific DNA-cytosine methylase